MISQENPPLPANIQLVPSACTPEAPARRHVAERWFAERLAFVAFLSAVCAIGIVVATESPVGLVGGPLCVFSIYATANWLFNVGRMKREAFVDEPQFAWKLFFAESYKFVGILLAAMLAAGLVGLARSCGK
jgi:hypothetical protein